MFTAYVAWLPAVTCLMPAWPLRALAVKPYSSRATARPWAKQPVCPRPSPSLSSARASCHARLWRLLCAACPAKNCARCAHACPTHHAQCVAQRTCQLVRPAALRNARPRELSLDYGLWRHGPRPWRSGTHLRFRSLRSEVRLRACVRRAASSSLQQPPAASSSQLPGGRRARGRHRVPRGGGGLTPRAGVAWRALVGGPGRGETSPRQAIRDGASL
jgi:hypothetical protein